MTTPNFARTRSHLPMLGVPAAPASSDRGATTERDTSLRAAMRRTVTVTSLVLLLALIAHAAAAIEVTLIALGVIVLAGFAAAVVAEANMRWHPSWVRAPRGLAWPRGGPRTAPPDGQGGTPHAR